MRSAYKLEAKKGECSSTVVSYSIRTKNRKPHICLCSKETVKKKELAFLYMQILKNAVSTYSRRKARHMK
jgi:hypothetical protein